MTQKRPPEQSFPNDQLDVLRVLGRVELSAQPTAREVCHVVAALGRHIEYTAIPAGEPSRAYAAKRSKASPQAGPLQNYSLAAVNDEASDTKASAIRAASWQPRS